MQKAENGARETRSRRFASSGGGGYTPHPMYECQKKGFAKRAIRKRMKIKRLFYTRKKGAICKCMKRKNDDFC